MILNIDLELSPEKEEALRLGIVKQDVNCVRALLVQALEPVVGELLRQGDAVSDEEFETMADEFADIFSEGISTSNHSNETFSRDAIYADHP